MLENISHSELNSLFSKYANSSSEPFFVINSSYEVVFANMAMENYVQKTMKEMQNSYFGNVLGCTYIEKGQNDCGNNYYCGICNLRNSFAECFKTKSSEIYQTVVRDFLLKDEKILKQIHIKTYFVEIVDRPHIAVSIIKPTNDFDSVSIY